jgi:hypothetical protein
MHVDLTAEEAAMLKGLLRDTLPDLKREIARRNITGFRHELVQREGVRAPDCAARRRGVATASGPPM